MKKTIFFRLSTFWLTLFFFTGTITNAKNKTAFKSDSSVRKYYVLTNKAELSIVDSNFKEAIKYYEAAFQIKTPNTKDLHNAYCASTFVKDCEKGRKYLEQLAIKGYRVPESLYENSAFFDCTAYGLKSKADKATEDFKYSVIGKKLDSLEREDQAVREAENPDFNKMKQVDAAVIKSLYHILQNESFTHVETGMWYGNPGNDYSTLFTIRWHGRGAASIIDDILLANVLKGNYDPGVYASLTSFNSNTTYGIYYNPSKIWTSEEIKIINKNRQSIFLEPISDYEKKAKMQIQTEMLRENLMNQYGFKIVKSRIFFKLIPDNFMAPSR